jgi:oligoendopeptidase F
MKLSTTWNIDQIFSRPIGQVMSDADAQIAAFELWRTKISDDIPLQDFAQLIEQYQEIADVLSRLNAYGQMLVDSDAKNPQSRALHAKIEEFESKADNRIRFFTHWWKAIDDENAKRLQPALGQNAYVFDLMRKLREHILPEEHENLLSIKDTTGVIALNNIYNLLLSRKTFPLHINGKDLNLTSDEIKSYFSDTREEVRKDAYQTYLRIQGEDREIISDIYRNIILNWEHERDLRKYTSAISIRNKGNDLPDEVVHAHLEACREGAKVWQRYFKLKSRLLGKKMHRYDLYAPLKVKEKAYTYEESVQITLQVFKEFSPRMAQLAEEIYEKHHVDALPRPNKASGAYCWMVTPQLPPFILYNFTGKLYDVSTVAHETGHGVHNQLCRHLTPLSFSQPIPIAETASIFAEMLLSEKLLHEEHDVTMKQYLLMRKLDDLYASIGRQAFFVLFELEAHRMFSAGATSDEVAQAYLKNLQEQFDGIMELPAEFENEWLGITHFFHTPFYCYGYSFGNLLTLGLYEQYKQKGPAFVPDYEKFLSAGSTMSPTDLCREIGIDISTKEFWQKGFHVVDRMIDDLEKLSPSKGF